MHRCDNVKRQPHPRERSNILSKLSFFYMLKLFVQGYTKELEAKDIYEVLPDSRSEVLGNRLESQWNIQSKTKTKLLLCRSLWLCFWKNLIFLGTIQFAAKLMMTILLPTALSKVVAFFTPGQDNVTQSDAIFYATVVLLLKTVNLFVVHNLNLALSKLGIAIKAAVVSLIYRKLLKLTSNSLSSVTVGKITTILNKDCEIFQGFIFVSNEVWIGVVQTVTVCFLIYNKIGATSLAGLVFFLIVLPLQMLLGKLGYDFRMKCNRKTDERLEMTKEVLSAIKVIKMYGWENYFEKKISKKRKQELNKLHKLFYSKLFITTIAGVSSKVALFIFVMTYIWSGHNVTAEIVYYIVSCINDVEISLSTTLPSGLSRAAETFATVKRCESILEAEEISSKLKPQRTNQPKIILQHVCVEMQQAKSLNNVSLKLVKALHVVEGHVGCGKTTFLKIILHEIARTGEVHVSGRISFASQDPWLFPATIKNNILFGEDYCEQRYKEVLKVTCLDYDLKRLKNGDDASVGENGINLSKGQQARVNLARALYRQSDIYLLDDCLAFLDAHVSDYIFEHAFRRFLHNKLCVFVTNNKKHFLKAHNVIMITKNVVRLIKTAEETVANDSTYFNFDGVVNEDLSASTPAYHEKKNSGKVALVDYYKYIHYGGGILVVAVIFALFVATQACASSSDKFLSNWVTAEQDLTTNRNSNFTNETLYQKRDSSLKMYITVVVLFLVVNLVRSVAYFAFVRLASMNLHNAMLHNVLSSTINFFDCTYIGTILTRFSKDCVTVDEYVAFILMDCVNIIFLVFGAIVLLTSVSVVFLIESFVLLFVAYLVKHFCQPTGRNLQRLHVIARGPMVGHVNSTLEGLITIRASDAEEVVIKEFDRYQDVFTSAHYMLNTSLYALSFILELFCVVFIASVIIQFLISDSVMDVGDVGLAITQSFSISQVITNGIYSVSDCENLMTSVERMLEYTKLEEENKNATEATTKRLQGAVKFNDVSLSYNEQGVSLSNINFEVNPKETLGIVGRTGAGKSSIVSSLLRLYEIQGQITIDNLDIKEIPLDELRSNLSILPQTPFIFTGTFRENLDPLNRCTDDQIYNVLKELCLNEVVDNLGLKIDNKLQMSVGQKQLLCLARVILRKSKIVVFDEATANVDHETECLVQEIISRTFKDCTVIIIAHRILSVVKCDRILVMTDGKIEEYDTPIKLSNKKDSFFHRISN